MCVVYSIVLIMKMNSVFVVKFGLCSSFDLKNDVLLMVVVCVRKNVKLSVVMSVLMWILYELN